MQKKTILVAAAVALALACKPRTDAGSVVLDDEDAAGVEYKVPVEPGTKICEMPNVKEIWPHALPSATHPMVVHFHKPGERALAEDVLRFAEKGWDYHVKRLGFRPTLDDHGKCGDDGRFDIFIWRGHYACQVDIAGDNPETPHDDRIGYMIFDPWGPYGGAETEETVVHEMAHASQATDDWNDTPFMYEMSAIFLDSVYHDRYIKDVMRDFQQHTDWSLDYDDKYETWYMYGAALYLHYLRDRHFGGDLRFISDLWLKIRNPPGAESEPKKNEPDYADVLDVMLKAKQTSFLDSVLEFSRWRYYTGSNIDERHFKHFSKGFENIKEAGPKTAGKLVHGQTTPLKVTPAPMMLGSSFVELSGPPNGEMKVLLKESANPSRRFAVQAVPGLTEASDGETIDLGGAPKAIKLDANGKRTLIVTVLPTGAYDPEERGNARHKFELAVVP